MKGTIIALIVILSYTTLAIFLAREAYWVHGWPLWLCLFVVAVPITILGCLIAPVFYIPGSDDEDS